MLSKFWVNVGKPKTFKNEQMFGRPHQYKVIIRIKKKVILKIFTRWNKNDQVKKNVPRMFQYKFQKIKRELADMKEHFNLEI